MSSTLICLVFASTLLGCNSATETTESGTRDSSNSIALQESINATMSTADSTTTSVEEDIIENFVINIKRNAAATGNLLKGTISVNNKVIGTTYENNNLKIRAGTYPGFLRYISRKGHVQGTNGYMGDTGDFLLEIGEVTWGDGSKRTHLLFHGGDKPDQSQGCIMLGPVGRDAAGNRVLSEDHTLRKLRKDFYGTDDPISSPNKKISIVIN